MQTYEKTFYLCFRTRANRYANPLRARLTERQPSLEAGEIAIKCTVDLPVALFQRPLLQARIAVPADKVSPARIDASIADNLVEVIRAQTGLDVRLTVEGQD